MILPWMRKFERPILCCYLLDMRPAKHSMFEWHQTPQGTRCFTSRTWKDMSVTSVVAY
jgi:hypothetical protein